MITFDRNTQSAVFGGAVSKDTVSRVWRKVKGDWDAWNARSLAEEPIIRVILDGTVVRVRLDRKATSIVLLVPGGKFQDCGRKPPSRRPCAQLGKKESGIRPRLRSGG